MPTNDPIADMLTRIRNAANAGFPEVCVPHSKIKESIAHLLAGEGFLRGVQVAGEGVRKQIVIGLKYDENKDPIFSTMKRESKLGRRRYVSAKEIKSSRQGMGVSLISTSKGIMKDTDAKRQGIGGEVLCTVW